MAGEFVGQVPEFTIEDGVVRIARGPASVYYALRTFRLAVAKAQRVLAEHDARVAPVIPMERHAARS